MAGTAARLLVASVGLALAVLAALAFGQSRGAGEAQERILVGIDAEPADNTATSLGSIEGCVSVEPGGTVDVDIFVENIVDLSAWQAEVIFDPAVVRVTAYDARLFLVAKPGDRLLDLSQEVPNDTGTHLIAVADFGTVQAQGESGSGALARLTLEAVGTGTSGLELSNVVLVNSENIAAEDVNGDTYYDGAKTEAVVAVGAPCPEETAVSTPEASPTGVTPAAPTAAPTATGAAPSPTPTTPTPALTTTPQPPASGGAESDDDGFPWAVVGGVAGGLVAVAVLGLVLRWRLRPRQV